MSLIKNKVQYNNTPFSKKKMYNNTPTERLKLIEKEARIS